MKPEEKTLGQKFLIDVDAWMDLRVAGKSDNLSDTISYTDIYRLVIPLSWKTHMSLFKSSGAFQQFHIVVTYIPQGCYAFEEHISLSLVKSVSIQWLWSSLINAL